MNGYRNGKDGSGMMKKGFTIVEIMVVVVVVTIIFGAFFTVLLANQRAWHSSETQLQIHQQARQGMQKMLKELRQAGTEDFSAGLTNTVEFATPANTNTVTYSLGGLNTNQLLRSSGGITNVLANNIIDLQFEFDDTNQLLDVTLTASRQSTFQDTLTTTLHSRVRPRN